MRPFLNLFEQRVRGIRLIELVGIAVALAMIFWVCLSKAREGEDIKRMNDLDSQISEQQDAVAALRIRVANLERPSRLEALAVEYLGMKPVSSAHEADIESIGEISRTTSKAMAPAPVVQAAESSATSVDLIQTVPGQPAPAATVEVHP